MHDRGSTESTPARRHREERIIALVGRQHGVITRAQLLEVGLSPAAIARRLKSGTLRAVHRGVYLAVRIEPDRARDMAAVLAGGSTAGSRNRRRAAPSDRHSPRFSSRMW